MWACLANVARCFQATPTQRALVQAYQATVNADRVDIDLIVKLVDYILKEMPAGDGAILVFLPGREG